MKAARLVVMRVARTMVQDVEVVEVLAAVLVDCVTAAYSVAVVAPCPSIPIPV